MVESTQQHAKKIEPLVPKVFGENEAGIEEYLSTNNVTIRCVIKHRFSDFIVNEIDENGQVVWFTPENDLQKWRKGLQQPVPGAPTGDEESKQSMAQATGEQEKEEVKLDEEKLAQFAKLISDKEF